MKYFVKFLIFTFLFTEMLVSSEKINIFNFDDNDLTKFNVQYAKLAGYLTNYILFLVLMQFTTYPQFDFLLKLS